MHTLETIDQQRQAVSKLIPAKQKSNLGQFMTPSLIADFMASLFSHAPCNEIRLLDAGAGIGSLTASFIEEFNQREQQPNSIKSTTYEIDPVMRKHLATTLSECGKVCNISEIVFSSELHSDDFIELTSQLILNGNPQRFTHAILNPPYKKINSASQHRKDLRTVGIETSNLYTAFVALSILMLEEGGELVAITPRSFCNGPYFKPFRKLLLDNMALKHIHVFESRDKAFGGDEVLQENIIFHAIKGGSRDSIVVSSSIDSDFEHINFQKSDYNQVVKPNDPDMVFHLATNNTQIELEQQMGAFTHILQDMGVEVSTGPVVDFRLRKHIKPELEEGYVPLVYAAHFDNGFIVHPRADIRKANAFEDMAETHKWLLPSGWYTLVRRMSSKEEKKRLITCVLNPTTINHSWIGFENHLNVFHCKKQGLTPDLAKGLSVFLSSTLLDMYFRQFNGHTQVNASDLRMLRYPSRDVLMSIGSKVGNVMPDQAIIDTWINQEIARVKN